MSRLFLSTVFCTVLASSGLALAQTSVTPSVSAGASAGMSNAVNTNQTNSPGVSGATQANGAGTSQNLPTPSGATASQKDSQSTTGMGSSTSAGMNSSAGASLNGSGLSSGSTGASANITAGGGGSGK